MNGDDPNATSVAENAFTPVETFGLGEGCRWRAANTSYDADGTNFTLLRDGLSSSLSATTTLLIVCSVKPTTVLSLDRGAFTISGPPALARD